MPIVLNVMSTAGVLSLLMTDFATRQLG